jgi:hypothetical protein
MSARNELYLRAFSSRFKDFPDGYESYLKALRDDNLIDPSINISLYHKWMEGRQSNKDERNPFLQWLQYVLGITTTTPSPPLTPPENCAECHCGKINNNRIVGGTETGIKYE